MVKIRNLSARVISINDINIIPGTDGQEFSEDVLQHPRIKKLIEKGDLSAEKLKQA